MNTHMFSWRNNQYFKKKKLSCQELCYSTGLDVLKDCLENVILTSEPYNHQTWHTFL